MSSLLALDKEFAFCRVKGGHAKRGERAWGDGSESGVHGEGPTQGWGARARAERTENMWYISVTLDVSKGWYFHLRVMPSASSA